MMVVDFDWTVTTSLIFSIVAMLIAVVRSRGTGVDGRIGDNSKRIDGHDVRLQSLEQNIQGLPGKGELHRLELQLSSIAGDLRVVTATMAGNTQIMNRVETIVARHEDHLLEATAR